MSNLLAAIGLAQMEILNKRVDARRKNYAHYKEIFKNLKQLNFLDERTEESLKIHSNRWITTAVINKNNNGPDINQIIRLLDDKNIEIRPLWKPMNLQPILSKYQYYGTGLEEKIYNKGFCLPSGSSLSIVDKKRIHTNLSKILNI